MTMRSVVSSRIKAVGLHTLAQVTTIHSVAGNWTAGRGSHGNVTTKIFIGNKSSNKEAEAARKRFGSGDEENMLLNIGSHGSVPTKTFIGNKSRNKEVEAARKRFELGDVINMLNDINSQGNVATKTFIRNKSRNKEAEGPRKIFSLKDRTHFLVDILLRLKDSKEAVYGALDAFAACEEKFPLIVLKRALYQLEQKQQWHRIIQVTTRDVSMADTLHQMERQPYEVFPLQGSEPIGTQRLDLPFDGQDIQ